MTPKKTKKVKTTKIKPALAEPSPERSAIMRAVKSKNTKPELAIQAFLRSKRFKFEMHADLPGRPDFVLPGRKIAIRVMGCFWHGHLCKRGARQPKTNTEYWHSKVQRNVHRDKANKADLEKSGWRVIDVWECQLSIENFFLRLRNNIKSL